MTATQSAAMLVLLLAALATAYPLARTAPHRMTAPKQTLWTFDRLDQIGGLRL